MLFPRHLFSFIVPRVLLALALSMTILTVAPCATFAVGANPMTVSDKFQKQYTDAATNKTVSLTSGKNAPLSVAGQAHMLSFKGLLERVIDVLATLIGTASLVFLVIGGIRLIVAGGNDTATTRAKDMITYAAIGLVITLLAYAIVGAWQGFLFR